MKSRFSFHRIQRKPRKHIVGSKILYRSENDEKRYQTFSVKNTSPHCRSSSDRNLAKCMFLMHIIANQPQVVDFKSIVEFSFRRFSSFFEITLANPKRVLLEVFCGGSKTNKKMETKGISQFVCSFPEFQRSKYRICNVSNAHR